MSGITAAGVATAALGGVAASVIGSMINPSGGNSAPAPAVPTVADPTPLPDPNSPAALQASKKKAASFYGQQMTQANTVLTGSDKLG